MKALIIYKSIHHQNTKKIALAIAKILNAKIITPEKVKVDSLKKFDLIGFGSGIYFSQHHKSLFKLIDKIKARRKQKVFIFSTKGFGLKAIYHYKLKKKLLNKGFPIIGEFSCPGWDDYPFLLKKIGGINKNRPDKKDIKKAQQFAKKLLNYF